MATTSEEASPRTEEFELKSAMPAEWQDGQVWVSTLRVFLVPQESLPKPIEFELIGVKGLLFWGVAAFFKATQHGATARWRNHRSRRGRGYRAY
jgi:hypothetical protein